MTDPVSATGVTRDPGRKERKHGADGEEPWQGLKKKLIHTPKNLTVTLTYPKTKENLESSQEHMPPRPDTPRSLAQRKPWKYLTG